MAGTLLLADIGGTNARFALARGGRLVARSVLHVAGVSGPVPALGAFLDQADPKPRPRVAALAVAGPVRGGRARLTNSGWRVDAAALRARFGFREVVLVNDFEALAWAVPRLKPRHWLSLGGGRAAPGAPVAVLGPGTGLGMAAWIPDAAGPKVLTTEGGHVTIPAADGGDARMLEVLRGRFGHVSAERVLSGDGLVHLYETIGALEGQAAAPADAAAISARALAGTCPLCKRALEAFCAMLGTFAGDAALSLGARGGVYLAGGISPQIADALAGSAFRARFEAKGRFRAYMAAIPTRLVIHPAPAFLGLMEMMARRRRA